MGIKIYWSALAFSLLAMASPAYALNSVTVMADKSMSVAIAEIARDYSREREVVVNTSFAPPRADEAQIIGGADADVLITPKHAWIDKLKEHGLIDIYSESKVASSGLLSAHYFAVVIAGDNMDEARKFLEYLKSDEAQDVLKRNGFGAE
jgi:ABC-type molybdate transport system substrate-binding protein